MRFKKLKASEDKMSLLGMIAQKETIILNTDGGPVTIELDQIESIQIGRIIVGACVDGRTIVVKTNDDDVIVEQEE